MALNSLDPSHPAIFENLITKIKELERNNRINQRRLQLLEEQNDKLHKTIAKKRPRPSFWDKVARLVRRIGGRCRENPNHRET